MATQATHATIMTQAAESASTVQETRARRRLGPVGVATLACLALIGGYGIVLTVVSATILNKSTEGLLFLFLALPGAGIGWTIGTFAGSILETEAA